MNDDERATLEDWTAGLLAALALDDFTPDIDALLDLAGAAAHAAVRPAAPVTTFLVGYAAGLLVGQDKADEAAAVATSVETALRMAHELGPEDVG